MEIVWKNESANSPSIIGSREAGTSDFRVRQMRAKAGAIPDFTYEGHGINLTLTGSIITRRQTSGGKNREDLGNLETMCLIPAGQTICAEWEDGYESVMVDFSPVVFARTARELGVNENIDLRETISDRDQLIANLSLAWLAEAEKNDPASTLYTDSLVQTLMFHIIKNYSSAIVRVGKFIGGLSGYRLRQVKEFINENLDHDLNLSNIADVAGLSNFHFARSFSKTLGVTPQRYVATRRIERAKELLTRTNLPIIEICLQTGFKNQSHFSTAFRKMTSYSPKLWRELTQA